MTDYADEAKKAFASHRGIGMKPPFYAETACVKGNQDWPLWIVRNLYCNSTGKFYSREDAEGLASAMNDLAR